MNLPLFEQARNSEFGKNTESNWEGPLLSQLPVEVLQSWWEESGWESIKFHKLIDRLSQLNTRLIPEKITKEIIKANGDFSSLFYIGNLRLLTSPIASVVGTRKPSEEGKKRTAKVAKDLVESGFVVMSGLARGVDTIAHETALSLKGDTIAVLGTPFHRIYPAENKHLFERILEAGGLCITPALPFQEHGTWLFPKRNKLMAILSRGTIVTEVGPTSGVKHQCAECLRKGRKLIFLKSLADNPELTWVHKFIDSGGEIVTDTSSLNQALR